MHGLLGKITDDMIQKEQKNQLPLLKSLEQKQGVRSQSRVLHMPSAQNTTKGLGKSGGQSLEPLWEGPYQLILSSPTESI